MTIPNARQAWKKTLFVALLLVLPTSVIGLWVSLNTAKIDSILVYIYGSIVGPHHFVACYPNFLLRATSERFFEFASGYGRNSLADVRLQFPDGSVYNLSNLPPEAVETIYPRKTVDSSNGSAAETIRYSSGFNRFKFIDGRLEGVTLTKFSDVKIDFGDGKFWELPIPRDALLEVLGDPIEWQASRTSLP